MSFSPINAEDLVISSESIISTLWSLDRTTLNNIYKKTNPEDKSYLDVFADDINIDNNIDPQFSITYGNSLGSGSFPINPLVPEMTPTRITYGQIRTLINGDENKDISFGTGNNKSEDFYLININRSQYKEKLFPHTFNLKLANNLGSLNLTTNSRDLLVNTYCDAGRIFDIVKGVDGSSSTINSTTSAGSYGKFLPDVGLILLNPKALSLSFANGGLGIIINKNKTKQATSDNNNILFNLIKNGSDFALNSEETSTTNLIFVRVKNSEFNYTSNPSIINESGEFYHSSLINNPQTYITTVGLYNDKNELLCVAKLSVPMKKDFTKESLIKLKLEF